MHEGTDAGVRTVSTIWHGAGWATAASQPDASAAGGYNSLADSAASRLPVAVRYAFRKPCLDRDTVRPTKTLRGSAFVRQLTKHARRCQLPKQLAHRDGVKPAISEIEKTSPLPVRPCRLTT